MASRWVRPEVYPLPAALPRASNSGRPFSHAVPHVASAAAPPPSPPRSAAAPPGRFPVPARCYSTPAPEISRHTEPAPMELKRVLVAPTAARRAPTVPPTTSGATALPPAGLGLLPPLPEAIPWPSSGMAPTQLPLARPVLTSCGVVPPSSPALGLPSMLSSLSSTATTAPPNLAAAVYSSTSLGVPPTTPHPAVAMTVGATSWRVKGN
uniref:Uncharacterized protein n=1 Tax=Zea mays TaxID=4577 RepID=A0A804P297_MAIZE